MSMSIYHLPVSIVDSTCDIINLCAGANRYYYMCLGDLLGLGGGGNFALCLDGDL